MDRIGQELPIIPIVNLYLQNSVDERVYRALAQRCGLFETFVGPMQPVLSQALRMLIGREDVDEEALARAAEAIKADPAIMQAFPEEEPVTVRPEDGLMRPDQVGALLSALDGTGVDVKAETNALHIIGGGPLRIVTQPSAVVTHADASCLDGLDVRQWQILRQLQQPGERLPLVLASAEEGAFRVTVCSWVSAEGVREVRSFADLQVLVTAWDGHEAPNGAWRTARTQLAEAARQTVLDLAKRRAAVADSSSTAQLEAARLRLVEELGRTLVCFEPYTDDLNGKFHRLATEQTATAERFSSVFHRLGGYPEWSNFQIADLREFRAGLTSNQVKTRLTGRELDAAMSDPRWATRLTTSP